MSKDKKSASELAAEEFEAQQAAVDRMLNAGLSPHPDLDEEDEESADRGDDLEPAAKPDEEEETDDDAGVSGDEEDEDSESDDDSEDDSAESDDPDDSADSDDDEDDGEEDEDDSSDADDAGKKPSGKWIPKERFDEVNEKRKAAEKKLNTLEAEREVAAGRPAADEGDKAAEHFETFRKNADVEVAKLEKKAMELAVDGEFEKAAEVRAKIRQIDQQVAQVQARLEARQTTQSTKEELAQDAAIAEAYEKYPLFDPSNKDEYDQDLVDEVNAMQAGYMSRGLGAAAALRRAVKVVAKLYDLDADPEVEDDPKPEPKPKKVKKTNVKQKAAAANKQPPDMPKGGKNEVTAEVTDADELSEDEWDALPESKKRQLRGDVL